MSYGVGHRGVLDPILLWLRHRPGAVAPLQLLAWELPLAIGAVLKSKKKKRKMKKKLEIFMFDDYRTHFK